MSQRHDGKVGIVGKFSQPQPVQKTARGVRHSKNRALRTEQLQHNTDPQSTELKSKASRKKEAQNGASSKIEQIAGNESRKTAKHSCDTELSAKKDLRNRAAKKTYWSGQTELLLWLQNRATKQS